MPYPRSPQLHLTTPKHTEAHTHTHTQHQDCTKKRHPNREVHISRAISPLVMERFRLTSWPTGVDEALFRPKKVAHKIHVHAEFRRITHRREGTSLIDGIYKDTGCIVVAHWDQSRIERFDVYAGPGSKSAVAAINKWIARGDQKSKESSAWAKTPAFNQAQWYQEKLEQMEEEQMEFFLGPIPEVQGGEPMRPKVTTNRISSDIGS